MDTNILDELGKAIEASLKAGISDEAVAPIKKKMRDTVDDVFGDIEYRVKEDLAPILSGFVKDNSAKVVNALLEGNESEMRRYIGCREGYWNGRSDGQSGWGRKREIWEWHPVIHGDLFEQGYLLLRRRIVEAHQDLITSERIKDLEDQVAALTAQVNRERDAREKLAREYSR